MKPVLKLNLYRHHTSGYKFPEQRKLCGNMCGRRNTCSRGLITLGGVQAFIQYSRQFTQPVIQVASITNVLQSAVASAEQVFELLDEEEEIPDTENPVVLENVKGHVRFEHVCFSYCPRYSFNRGFESGCNPAKLWL